MNIEKITVENFRNIGMETSFFLNAQFTTIIGINGKGKSSLLTALKIAAGTYLLGIPESPKRHIWESEIRRVDFQSHLSLVTPTIIKAQGSIDGLPLKKGWTRQIPKGRTKTTSNLEDVGEIRTLAQNKYQAYQSGDTNIDNPVIAFFGTGRLYGPSRLTLGAYIGREVFKYGYYAWSDMQYSTYNYAIWLRAHRFMVNDKRESPELYEAFMVAIKTSNPYITDIDFDGEELRMKVKMQDGDNISPYLPLSLHSDGFRTHTAMVAELAYRCIMLNAHHGIESIKKSRGVVLIDEIDLHLHPNWQRHIVADLKAAFPCIQFIVTTHSPFIVQSLKSDELINLDALTDIDPTEFSVDEIATNVMQVDSEFSVKNEDKYELTKEFLKDLDDKNMNSVDLENKLDTISDPALRAFLEINKTIKGK